MKIQFANFKFFHEKICCDIKIRKYFLEIIPVIGRFVFNLYLI